VVKGKVNYSEAYSKSIMNHLGYHLESIHSIGY